MVEFLMNLRIAKGCECDSVLVPVMKSLGLERWIFRRDSKWFDLDQLQGSPQDLMVEIGSCFNGRILQKAESGFPVTKFRLNNGIEVSVTRKSNS